MPNYTDEDIGFALYSEFVSGWGFFNSSDPKKVNNITLGVISVFFWQDEWLSKATQFLYKEANMYEELANGSSLEKQIESTIGYTWWICSPKDLDCLISVATTYRSTKSIINLHSCIATALKRNSPSGNPGTEVVGELPRLVVLGDLRKLEEKEMAARIRFGLNMVKSFVAGKEESEVTLIDDSGRSLSSLLAKQAEEFSWTMKNTFAMFGGEADRVVVVGVGNLEAISRSRLSLAVLLCCHDEDDRRFFNRYAPGYKAAIEQGLVEVALPPWHPQVKLNFSVKRINS